MNKQTVIVNVVTFGLCLCVGTFLVGSIRRLLLPSPPVVNPVEILAAESVEVSDPRVISTVDWVKIVSLETVEVINGSPELRVHFRNNSDKAIIGFWIESTDGRDKDASSSLACRNGAKPLFGPNTEFTINVGLANFKTNSPIRFSAVVFADGSISGDESGVSELRQSIARNCEQ